VFVWDTRKQKGCGRQIEIKNIHLYVVVGAKFALRRMTETWRFYFRLLADVTVDSGVWWECLCTWSKRFKVHKL